MALRQQEPIVAGVLDQPPTRLDEACSGRDYFFHQSAVQGEGINDLREGDSVEFEVGDGPKGPRAQRVRRTSL
jgi:cold shock CspA family protein